MTACPADDRRQMAVQEIACNLSNNRTFVQLFGAAARLGWAGFHKNRKLGEDDDLRLANL